MSDPVVKIIRNVASLAMPVEHAFPCAVADGRKYPHILGPRLCGALSYFCVI